jgi:hypothetical protein
MEKPFLHRTHGHRVGLNNPSMAQARELEPKESGLIDPNRGLEAYQAQPTVAELSSRPSRRAYRTPGGQGFEPCHALRHRAYAVTADATGPEKRRRAIANRLAEHLRSHPLLVPADQLAFIFQRFLC